ncbi:cell adhesion molecule 4-like isoform X2 [Clarias gariepinus]|uniref:cell adhesion molecule 4-like isoform X2 n=1 Tax=Clarias gariepinus TaxID=13013 RepID=UPI00234DD295|nr:cell adhesion molecule 4-like isoform X2 [Clarias gariepinus]
MLYLTQLTGLILITLSNGGCPLEIRPGKLVVEFGASVSANCSTNTTHHGMGWEASQGAVDLQENVQSVIWRVDHLTHWDIQPICFIIKAWEQRLMALPVTVYKRPDQVSISTVDHTEPMIEGRQYKLLCDVQNVAPVHLLTVNWYKGHHFVKRESVSGENKFPVNVNVTLQISLSKDDDGVQYRCEAGLNLGPEGPQRPPIVTSDPLNITVHYDPEIEAGKATEVVMEGEAVSLICTAGGNPEPEVTWSFHSQTKATGRRKTTFTIWNTTLADDGVYTCTATNELGSDTRTVSVQVQGNQLQAMFCVKA